MLREFCAENMIGVEDALRAGAQRVELCGDLSVGGVTPADEVISKAVGLIHGLGATVMVIIRPRGGDFAYDESELSEMERAIQVAAEQGADGVVFGCVREGLLDVAALKRLVRAADSMDMTFHMAFDELDPAAQEEALGCLSEFGFSRVLTHGGPLSQPIDECLPRLRELVCAAGDAIAIMPGGGVTWENAERICDELGVGEVHGTRIVRL